MSDAVDISVSLPWWVYLVLWLVGWYLTLQWFDGSDGVVKKAGSPEWGGALALLFTWIPFLVYMCVEALFNARVNPSLLFPSHRKWVRQEREIVRKREVLQRREQLRKDEQTIDLPDALRTVK